MAKTAETKQAPSQVTRAATQYANLPAGRLALLGTFLRGETGRALVRTASGSIYKVEPGDHIGYATVTGIDHGALHLVQGGMARKVTMPRMIPSPPPRTRPRARPARD